MLSCVNVIGESSPQGFRMKKIKSGSIAFVAAAAVIGLLHASSTVRADDSVGTISQLSGAAQIQRGGTTLAAQQGAPLKLHDTVTTQPDASVTLGFADGSSIALSGSTSVAIEESIPVNGQAVASRVTLISGDIHTIVPDKEGRPHSIEVNTANAKVTGPSPNQ
jgi:hypothetical protein